MAPLVDTKVGRTWLLGFALISIGSLALVTCVLRKENNTVRLIEGLSPPIRLRRESK